MYLAILTPIYSKLTGWSLVLAASAVVLGATIIIAVIAIFCVKWVERKDGSRQVRLSTLFLPFIPISIYLALYSQLLQAIRDNAPKDFEVAAWIIFLPFALFVALTTIVLMHFGEALVWLLLRCRRAWANSSRSKD